MLTELSDAALSKRLLQYFQACFQMFNVQESAARFTRHIDPARLCQGGNSFHQLLIIGGMELFGTLPRHHCIDC